LARRYGWGLAVGRSIHDVDDWPHAIAKVTLDDVKKVAATYLDPRRSVTGWLVPEAPESPDGSGERVEQPVVHSRS
jgi:zinc protease